MTRPQERHWPKLRLGAALRLERHFGDRVFPCFAERPANLWAMFADMTVRGPDREAVVGGEVRLRYRELADRAERVAASLLAAGFAPGERIALLLGNRAEFVIAVLACARAGLIAVPLGTRQPRPEIAALIADCAAAALIFEAPLAAAVPLPEEAPSLRRRFVVGDADDGAEAFATLLAPRPVPSWHVPQEEDCAVILYTSGTTGRPKGAMLSHLGILHSAMSFMHCVELGPEDRSIVAVPASHVTGLVGVLFATLCAGGCAILMERYKTPDFLELAARERMSYTIVVPAIYTLCMMEPDLSRYDLSAWRIGCFGGAPMPEATIEMLARRLPDLILVNAYGATETSAPSTIMPPGENLAHPASIGQVVPCGEIIIVDPEGRQLPPGSPGELWIRGPHVVAGYWDRPEANAASFTNGFWHSGDIGTIDAEGFAAIHDRAKDMINRGGFKIYSAEVENTLSHHPDIVECAIVGRPDPVLGERVVAYVVPRQPSLTAEAIRAFCLARMADYKVPEQVELQMEPLPRNANGKLQKGVLRQRLAGG